MLTYSINCFVHCSPFEINYTLTYDIYKLSAGGAFDTSGSNNSLIVQLYYVSTAIVADTSAVSGNWTIEPVTTSASLEKGMVAGKLIFDQRFTNLQ
jgi:hypothetical protein